jgi:hypothetical protein
MKIETRNQIINNIEDKVIAVNTLHKHINKVTPKILELLKDNLTLKKDNSLTKKSNNLISKYIGYDQKQFKNNQSLNYTISCYIDDSYNSFGLLTFSIRYKNQYIKEDVYLWDNVREWCSITSEFVTTSVTLREFTPRKTKTIKQVKNAIKKVNTLNNKIETLNDTIRSEINRFNNFLERV